MIGDFIVVSKEEAIRRIEDAPGDVVLVSTISRIGDSNLYTASKKQNKKDGRLLVVAADEVLYQDNDIFGILSLKGIVEKTIHNLGFSQLE